MLDVLREDRPAIDNHVEGATPPRHNRRFEPELARNGSRQTGGLGSIVSTNAVFDGDLHADDHIDSIAGEMPSSKSQAPNPNTRPIPKIPDTPLPLGWMGFGRWDLGVGIWLGIWALGVRWDLELGAWDFCPYFTDKAGLLVA